MESEKVVIEGKNIKQTIDRIKKEFGYYSFNPSKNVFIFFSEKYYFRNNSDLMAAVIVTLKEENRCEIEIVCGGGGEGLFSSDLGAESSRINKIINYVEKICNELNQKFLYNNA